MGLEFRGLCEDPGATWLPNSTVWGLSPSFGRGGNDPHPGLRGLQDPGQWVEKPGSEAGLWDSQTQIDAPLPPAMQGNTRRGRITKSTCAMGWGVANRGWRMGGAYTIRLRGWWRRGRLVVGGCLDPTRAAEDRAARENVGGKSFHAGGRTSMGYQGKGAEPWPTAMAGTSRIPPLVKKGPEAAPRRGRTRAPPVA